MKQVLQAPSSGMTVVREVPLPRCPPGGLLVQNAFSAISSGTERARVELSQKSLLGKARARPDLVREVLDRARREGVGPTIRAVQHRLREEISVGYSSAGTVVEMGEYVRGFQHGDLVACGGDAANHAGFVAVPANLCVRVPDKVPLEAAALTTIASIAMHGVRLADVRIGDRVAVVGCGLVGQIALRLLRAAGAETFALDVDPLRVEQARCGGADHAYVIDEATAERVWALSGSVGVDAALVAAAASSNEPLLLATKMSRDRGSVVLVGAVPIEFPRAPMYEKELSFRVARSYGPGRYDSEYEERGLDYPIGYVRWSEHRNMQAVLLLQAQGRVSLTDLVEVVPVEQASQAYARLTGGSADRPHRAIVLSYGEPSHGAFEAGLTAGASPTANGYSPKAKAERAVDRKTGIGARPVGIGLVGPGSFAGRVLVPALKARGAHLVVVGGGSGPSAAAAARTAPFRRTAPDEAAVFDDPQVDAAVICTRHISHAALATQALAAGKHVFCEKPLALTSAELHTVVTTATSAPGTLFVGFNRRFSPLLREMRSFLAAMAVPMTLVYRVSPGKLAEDHWLHDLAQGGGRVLGEVCHFIDSVSFLAGHPIVEVHASSHGPQSWPVQRRDNVVVSLRFADSAVASVVYAGDGSSRIPKERVEGFCGSRTAILDDYVRLDLLDAGRRQKRRLKSQDKGHRQEVGEFLNGVQTGRPAMSLSQIHNSSMATLAVVESMRTGEPVRLTTDWCSA